MEGHNGSSCCHTKKEELEGVSRLCWGRALVAEALGASVGTSQEAEHAVIYPFLGTLTNPSVLLTDVQGTIAAADVLVTEVTYRA